MQEPADEYVDTDNPYALGPEDQLEPGDQEGEVAEAMDKLSLFDFWSKLTFAPKRFFRENFRNGQSPFFALTFIVFSVASGIDRVDNALSKQIIKGNGAAIAQVFGSWPSYAILLAFGSLVAGAIYWVFGSWFYNVRIGWARGEKDSDRAKFLYLYSFFLPSLFTVLVKGIEIVTNPGGPLDSLQAEITTADIILALVGIACLFWSIYISYRGVREAAGVERGLGLFWFAVMPAVVYSLSLLALIAVFATLGDAQPA